MKTVGLLFFLLLSAFAVQAQSSDWQLVAGQPSGPPPTAYYDRPGNDADVLQSHRRSWIAQYNPVSLALKGAMLGYQRLVSQQLARSCPYDITCSNFSKQAIERFGVVKGVFLSADRIMRCNRIGLLDVHPLNIHPQRGTILDSPDLYR
ncbi:membrane protein insertion efficiency factor YidD [Tellurirhabdus rosea]|uniref:membrane protein insertion efficiency factor YidD n=1 Tax=Tellurirhabdus rosea TaxID=2674997 RepID=UPI00224CDF85|nr:membrane protein insertion efficiency factor YidD [Tellurirhabdus rosea]